MRSMQQQLGVLGNRTFRFLYNRESSPSPLLPRVCKNVHGVIHILYVSHNGKVKCIPVYVTRHIGEKEVYSTHSSPRRQMDECSTSHPDRQRTPLSNEQVCYIMHITTKVNTWTTDDSVVPTLAACIHDQSTALPLRMSELTVVKITEWYKKFAARAGCVPSLAIPYTKPVVMNGFWDHYQERSRFHKQELSRTKHTSSGIFRRTASYINVQVSKEYVARIFR